MLRIGIDIGGTFTDFVIYDTQSEILTTFKIPTDNNKPENTVIKGLEKIISNHEVQVVHGSTVATNALLERKGEKTALLTTRGFKDILQIGRQNRPNLYNLLPDEPQALVPPGLRFEISERIDSHGKIIEPINISEIESILFLLNQSDIHSVAVCLLFSFLYPKHEQLIAEYLRNSGYQVSLSSEILPEYREYERMSTTVVNAYVSPIFERYLSKLEESLRECNLQIMQSNGGMINIEEARKNGARCILSGPAGGIVGAQNITKMSFVHGMNGNDSHKTKIITFDMGGTSTDVSLIDGEPTLTTDAIVGGIPIHLPMLDIHTIGAGGGSIAYVDAGGSLRVGPQSAGADPGPACYGKGDIPTVTDANIVLGRLIPEYFLGGQMKIEPNRSLDAFKKLGKKLNLNPIHVALGVIDIVNIQMEKAVRVISVEKGHDPRDFSLFSFGGAGGLHACELARNIGIPRVIISKYASTLSAYGMLVSDVVKDYVQTVMLVAPIYAEELDNIFLPLVNRGYLDLLEQGLQDGLIETQCSLDMRYKGQSYELNIPYTMQYQDSFVERHFQTYGYSYSNKEIEIVNIRVRAIGKVPQIKFPTLKSLSTKPDNSITEQKKVRFVDGEVSIPLYIYDNLVPGKQVEGPALILSNDTTVLINRYDFLTVDKYQNLIISIDNHS